MVNNKISLIQYNKWCEQIVKLDNIASALIIIAQIIWLLAARSFIEWPINLYIRDFIILPGIGLLIINLLTYKIVHNVNTPIIKKEFCSLLLLVIISFYLSITHDNTKVLHCSYILPIIASTIFPEQKNTRYIFIISLIGELFVGVKAYLSGDLYQHHMLMEIFGTYFLLFCAYSLANILRRFSQSNLETLKKANEEAINNELAFYQAQINPHFLCNAINTIISLCYTNGEKAAALLANLTNYLQFTFDFNNKLLIVPLGKEIQLIMVFVEIEIARFGEKISVVYDIEPELFNIEIPSFCLEPLVENAIKHGLCKNDNGGTVTVIAKREKDDLILIVRDTGAGMPEEKMNRLVDCENSSEGIGFYNVKRRMTGWKDTTFDIQSIEGTGTTITMRVPGGAK